MRALRKVAISKAIEITPRSRNIFHGKFIYTILFLAAVD
jgi:hypothetical protein